MTVEACNKQKLMDDMDDDDGPLVFKRSSSSSSKQKQSNSETKRSVPHKHDQQLGRPASNARPQNGQNNSVQRSKIVPASKTPPDRPPPLSQKLSNSLPKESEVKSTRVDSRPSTSMRGELTSVKRQIKGENSLSGSTCGPKEESEDSEDDKPLSARLQAGRSKINSGNADKGANASNFRQTSKIPKSEDSDDEMPLSSKFRVKAAAGGSTNRSSTSGEKKPLVAECGQNGSASTDRKSSTVLKKRIVDSIKPSDASSLKRPKLSETSTPHKNKDSSIKAEMKEEDDEDHVPISQRIKKTAVAEKKSAPIKKLTAPTTPITKKFNKKPNKTIKNTKYSESSKVPPSSGEGQKWTTLVHSGVIFPPPYKPHGVKILYKGKPVDLTPEQEEVATMFAVMLDTEYMDKPKFKENFMDDWRKILGKNHIIQSLEHCDFTPIYDWHQSEKEKKKQMTTEEKKALKEEKLKQEEKYMWAIVDGVKEKVGNFRVEPPGLFRGRGEHPKMGKLKKRIRPSDITINIGRDAPIPECPIHGQSWKEIRHDNTVTWLAFWNDPINPKEFKYVFLAASSTLKGQSDKEKYEKARLLKNYIQGIRTAYTKDFTSKDPTKKQIAVATYLIDKLALRAGNEKDDDEADTVGCCTLKVENVEPVPPNILKLSRETKGGEVAEKVVVYQHANKEVAIICNHQRTVSKSHSAQMTRLNEKIDELKGVLEELRTDLARVKKGKPPLMRSDGKSKRNLNPDSLEKKISQTTAKIEKMERDKDTKEDLKTVALGTSKINYLDPRITVAWCKRHEVPIEKIFNKSLLAKFAWAMDVDPGFRF
ncbi:DNA topoisomerase 1 alpha-like isoform X2 [Salvia splendens]|uniref:DNA topoisomerase 1 alpha-like isoform X2 n=1 Tax=Salvia splendens TaxID=180675 RepID=UPI001C27CD15|nr:DNA topoisomerase 1 alpha-like isoform X2 [Salvia splendens]